MNRALVTGASGFIGQRLVKQLLSSQVAVRVLCRSENSPGLLGAVELSRADLENPGSLNDICTQMDVVFHLAGYAHAADQDSQQAEFLHRRVTVEGTRALLKEAEAAGVRCFIFLSSVKSMGEGSDTCLDETASESPASYYGRAKLEAERLVFEAGRRTGMHVAVLRLPLVYGSNVKGNLRQMIAAIDRGRFPPLPEVGNQRSMVHADDVVRALLLAAERPVANGQVYIVTDGNIYSTREMYEEICKALDRRVARWTAPLWLLRFSAWMGDIVQHLLHRSVPLTTERLIKLLGSACYSSDKIRRELGFVSLRTFIDSLPEMVAVYRVESKVRGG